MTYRERKARMKRNLRIIQEYFNMSRKEREIAIIEEQKKKFFVRGGKVKSIKPDLTRMSSDDTAAIDFLMGS